MSEKEAQTKLKFEVANDYQQIDGEVIGVALAQNPAGEKIVVLSLFQNSFVPVPGDDTEYDIQARLKARMSVTFRLNVAENLMGMLQDAVAQIKEDDEASTTSDQTEG